MIPNVLVVVVLRLEVEHLAFALGHGCPAELIADVLDAGNGGDVLVLASDGCAVLVVEVHDDTMQAAQVLVDQLAALGTCARRSRGPSESGAG